MKTALITGVTGQDGSYLASDLLDEGYKVTGIVRSNSERSMYRLKYLGIDTHKNLEIINSDITEFNKIYKLIIDRKFDYIYNLAAISFVGYSFDNPQSVFKTNTDAVLNMLEAVRHSGYETRFYQASTSEMYGNQINSESNVVVLNEDSKFEPVSPYGASKLAAHNLVKIYRESYGLKAVSGILFNHESFLRGGEFVTKKIVNAVNDYYKDLGTGKDFAKVGLGNINARRDWGWAPDYVRGMQLINNQKSIVADYVLATGNHYSVEDFINEVLEYYGLDYDCFDNIFYIDPKFYRDNELNVLVGDSSKAKADLAWKPSVDNLMQLVKYMQA